MAMIAFQSMASSRIGLSPRWGRERFGRFPVSSQTIAPAIVGGNLKLYTGRRHRIDRERAGDLASWRSCLPQIEAVVQTRSDFRSRPERFRLISVRIE
jgi:hypothetical protein